ncbi:MAG: hypothetical protein KC621_00935 [Myxococcales bacterium]|nr:hypothetical protein [Myxococcales bacterium]
MSLRPLALLALGLLATTASAESTNLGESANDPSYEVKPGTLSCKGDQCRVYVINDKGIGVEVRGNGEENTKKKGKKKADELNEEAEAGEVDAGEVVDTCSMFPDMC